MIPTMVLSDDATKLLSLAEAYEAEARERRRGAALATSEQKRSLLLDLANISELAAARIRLHVLVLPVEEPPLSAEFCPVDGCGGCHSEIRTITQVVNWLHTEPTVCEGWSSQMIENVQRFALVLLDLRDGVHAGRWAR